MFTTQSSTSAWLTLVTLVVIVGAPVWTVLGAVQYLAR